MTETVDANASDKRYRRNFLALITDWIMYGTGMNFVSFTTVIPAFVISLIDSKIALGLVSTVSVVCWNFFQLVSAKRLEAMRYKKPFLLKVTPGERIPWLIIAIATFFLATRDPLLVLLLFYVSYATINISSGLCTTAWLDILAKAIPEKRRGFYFTTANLIASIVGLASGVAVAFYMSTFDYPANYLACFLTAFLFILISWIAIALVDEPPSNVREDSSSFSEYLRKLPKILNENRDYRLFIISGLIGSFGGIASSFYTAYAIDRFKAGSFEIGLFTSVFVGAQILSNVLWGFIQAKYGHKTVLVMGGAVGAFAVIVAMLASSLNHFLMVFVLTGASFSSFMISNFPLLMEMAPEKDRPTYMGLSSAIKSPFIAIAPIMGGFIIDEYGYLPAFILSLVFATISTIILAMVRQKPRAGVEVSIREKLIKRF